MTGCPTGSPQNTPVGPSTPATPGTTLKPAFDLHQCEVAADARVPALHRRSDRREHRDDAVRRIDTRADLRDHCLAVACAVAGRADVGRRPIGEDEVHRAT